MLQLNNEGNRSNNYYKVENKTLFWWSAQLWSSESGATVRRRPADVQGTENTAPPLCPSAASHTGRRLLSPLSPCASASSGTPGTQPSARNRAPVDTRGENTEHLTKHLGPHTRQEAKAAALVKTLQQTFTHVLQNRYFAQIIERIFLFIIKHYQRKKRNH